MKLIQKLIKHAPLIVFVILFLATASSLVPSEDGVRLNFRLLPMSVVKAVFFAFLFASLSFNKVLSWIWFLLNLIFFEIVLFLAIELHTHITPMVLSLVLQTDANEAEEFFMSFFPVDMIMLLSAIAVISVLGYYAFGRIWSKRLWLYGIKANNLTLRRKRLLFLGIAGLWCLSLLMNVLPKLTAKLSERYIPGFVRCMVSHDYSANILYLDLYNSIRKVEGRGDIVDRIALANDKVLVDSCKFSSPNIVFIIGESFIKRHSSAYGYYLKTNPHIEKEIDSGNMFVFNDVITYAPSTSVFLQTFYSVKSIDDSLTWEDTPLFPAIFKKAGYRVSLFDNQSIRSNGVSVFDDYDTSFFLNPIKVHKQCFNYRNSELCPYDLDFVRAEKPRMRTSRATPSLNIIHLYGQHIKSRLRYPDEPRYNHFTTDSIRRPDIAGDKDKLQTIAEYDNATRYNDKVIKEILDIYRNDDVIVFYVSDHGDCKYDDENLTLGRMIEHPTDHLLRLYLEVPMFVWCSDTYKENHPDIVARISEAVDRPFMTDDLSHILFDVAGLYSCYYIPSRSVINPDYNERRRDVYICGEVYDYDGHKEQLSTITFPY